MIKNIIWDNIGVFTPRYPGLTVGAAAKFLNANPAELEKIWLKEAVLLDRGDITHEEFHERLMKAFNVHKGLKEVMDVHYSTYKQNEGVRHFAKSLSKDFTQVLLTNFGDNFDEWNTKSWKMEEIFGDKIVVSYRVRMVKPDAEIFQYTLDKFNLNAEETIFIDDSQKNVEGACKLGIKGLHFTSLEKLKEDFGQLIDEKISNYAKI